MRNWIMGFVLGFLLALSLTAAVASNISGEALWNRVYDSTLQTIKIEGI